MSTLPKSGFWKKNAIVFLAAAVVVLVMLITGAPTLVNVFEKAADSCLALSKTRSTDDPVLISVSREDLNKETIIRLTNNERAQNGLPALAENPLLDRIAELRARDMLEKQYFAHVSSAGQQASDIAQAVGYHYKVIAENIGRGDFYNNKKIVDGWMQSPGHRSNILSSEVEEIGAAVLKGNMNGLDTYVSVQIFGLQSLPGSQKICVAPSAGLYQDIELKNAEIKALNDQLGRMKGELDEEKESIDKDQRYTYDDPLRVQKLNERINSFNEKSRWYNKTVAEAKGKADAAKSMAEEYNRALKNYNDCQARHE